MENKRKTDAEKAEKWIRLAADDYCRRCNMELAADEELFKIARTEQGKPYFANCPQIHCSISHSGEYWICAMALEEIGVDLQQHVMMKSETREKAELRYQKMAYRFFHPLEAELVDQNCFENFFDVWSAKESYVKYIGTGIDRAFSQLCVIPKERHRWPRLSDSDGSVSWQAAGVWFTKVCWKDEYSLCFCTKTKKNFGIYKEK